MVDKLQFLFAWLCLLICAATFAAGGIMFAAGSNMLHQQTLIGQVVEKHAGGRPLVTFRSEDGRHHVLEHDPFVRFPQQGTAFRVRCYGFRLPLLNWYPTIIEMDDGNRRY